jgi:hypothetical protein
MERLISHISQVIFRHHTDFLLDAGMVIKYLRDSGAIPGGCRDQRGASKLPWPQVDR